ncbi:hypothetical protein GWI33_019642 [Rhynchophorus ferrugineus]|uniref:Uncharacterized protein n=1 Tax=Rhynchophorus ferrugineus TaxID=354439 RepID=A0A834HU00_RHYFE|nr:hypothetical protein GWI33_019642 [Rhynchophorus ferrugineus]
MQSYQKTNTEPVEERSPGHGSSSLTRNDEVYKGPRKIPPSLAVGAPGTLYCEKHLGGTNGLFSRLHFTIVTYGPTTPLLRLVARPLVPPGLRPDRPSSPAHPHVLRRLKLLWNFQRLPAP